MAEQHMPDRSETSPGSRIMAAALLETLTIRGRHGARDRAVRASGIDGGEIVDAPTWLDDDALARMLAAGSVESPVARALGHRLVAPESMGMPLYALGLATPEKAYRRLHALLPREAIDAQWLTEEIKDQSAWISYRPHNSSDASPSIIGQRDSQATRCALRRGMLESIPTLYGLLPATVNDPQCVARGDSVCRYRVDWQRGSRRGLAMGAGTGVSLGLLISLLGPYLGMSGLSAGAFVVAGLASFATSTAIGRCFDLVAQLEAVGGTRRGQLALFEQVDDQLAEKLDALTRVDARLDEEPNSLRVGLTRSHTEEREPAGASSGRDAEIAERERGIYAAAQAIHTVAGDLECWFDEEGQAHAATDETPSHMSEERGWVREIRDWAARISNEVTPEARMARSVDLAALVARGIASVRPMLPATAVVDLEVEENLGAVICDPVQIEQVIIQLVLNAIEASEAIMDAPIARVTLRRMRLGAEIAVEDRGAGIESSDIDEAFDPFFGEAPLGNRGGLGLPICLRIVEAHGGELRIETENRSGTRVSVFLPQDVEHL